MQKKKEKKRSSKQTICSASSFDKCLLMSFQSSISNGDDSHHLHKTFSNKTDNFFNLSPSFFAFDRSWSFPSTVAMRIKCKIRKKNKDFI